MNEPRKTPVEEEEEYIQNLATLIEKEPQIRDHFTDLKELEATRSMLGFSGYDFAYDKIDITLADIFQALTLIHSDVENIQQQLVDLEREMIKTAEEIAVINVRASITMRPNRPQRKATPPKCSHGHFMKRHKVSRIDIDSQDKLFGTNNSYWYCEQCIEGTCSICNTFHDEDDDPLLVD